MNKKNALMRPAGIKKTDAQIIEFWMSEDGNMSTKERRKAMRAGQGPELIKKYLGYLKRSKTPQKRKRK
jgi:RPA family protein